MRYILIILPVMLILTPLFAREQIRVEYDNGLSTDYINITTIDDIPYFNILELNKALSALISIDVMDRRLFVELYKKRLIFLLDSPYLLDQNDLYNFVYSIVNLDGKYYIPQVFLERVMPVILPGEVSFDPFTRTLFAGSPVDRSFRTIIIDPGHGGKDPGALGYSGDHIKEKDIVLPIAFKIKQLVEDNLDVQVLLTREDDSMVPLHARSSFSNRNNANLFISLHCNAAENRSAHGIEVYFLSVAKTSDARAVEMMENAVVEKYETEEDAEMYYDDLTQILIDMEQAEHLKESSYLALKLQANLVNATGARDRGVKQAAFRVLEGVFAPAVLVEFGFISNREEERKLLNESYQDILAQAVFEGIRSYIHSYDLFR
jgi:N-acetylmuramoyl-L-alanine amidase